VSRMEPPFTQEDREYAMIHSLWSAANGTPAERKQQIADAIRMTVHAHPKVKGERLFLLTLEWMKASRVVA
jgi:hypothetical protein